MQGNATQDGTPTPDAPQDIHVVTGDNTVVVNGKNLLDNTNLNYGYSNVASSYNNLSTIEKGIRYKSTFNTETPVVIFKTIDLNNYIGKTVRMKANYTTKGEIRLGIANSDLTTRVQKVSTYTSGNEISFTVTDDMGDNHYLTYSLAIRSISSTGDTVDFTNLIITIDNADMTYEPYTEQKQLLSLGSIELAKIGDYTDRIFKAVQGNSIYDSLDSTTKASLTSGSWYKEQNIKKLYLDGSQQVWYKLNNCFTITNSIISDIIKSNSSKVFVICDKYKGITTRYRDSVTDLSICKTIAGSSNMQISVKNTAYSTVTDFANSLEESPITVYYVLNTPTYTEITDTTLISQLENVLKMQTNKNITNAWLEPTGTNAQGGLILTYRQDINSTKQDKITSTNKLASDLVDDTNQTHKFVTSTEKTTWNSKQNKPVVLFSGNDLPDDVTLSQSANNFDYLEIFFQNEADSVYHASSVKVETSTGFANLVVGTAEGLLYSETIRINGSNISSESGFGYYPNDGTVMFEASTGYITITKVIGYKM